jgi:hypothetical protein
MKTIAVVALLVLTLFAFAGCDLVDPMRATPHSDTEIFGNLLEVGHDPSGGDSWVVNIRVGVPRALGRTDHAQPTPSVAGGILAVVTVTPDTVVMIDDAPGVLDDIAPGSEVVAIPVPGTTTMLGEKEVHLEAGHLMDFSTYARWRLPKLELPGGPVPTEGDPARINSPGVEHGAVPVAGGRVLYFAARLRPPVEREGEWVGAARRGMRAPAEGEQTFERTFRTVLGANGWSVPEMVVIPGTEEAEQVQLTWVNENETRCFATVTETGGEPWVGVSERRDGDRPWGKMARFEDLGEGDSFDAVAMASTPEKTVFATTRRGGGDLFLHDPALGEAQPLEPTINTGGLEWGTRVGPSDELYFVRGDRQLRFSGGRLSEVRLPGPQRTILIEAAPTSDGAWLFIATPRFRPMEVDLDIQVVPLSSDGTVGPPVPVDEWRPE